MRRKRPAYGKPRIDVPSALAVLFALLVIASLFWMKTTGNTFCCDPSSLVGQLRSQASADR